MFSLTLRSSKLNIRTILFRVNSVHKERNNMTVIFNIQRKIIIITTTISFLFLSNLIYCLSTFLFFAFSTSTFLFFQIFPLDIFYFLPVSTSIFLFFRIFIYPSFSLPIFSICKQVLSYHCPIPRIITLNISES